jgi:tRNA(fMet)-specific endonuclease VapC
VIFALDTDIFTLLVQGHERVTARHARIVTSGNDEVTIPVVVRSEVLTGRFEAIKKAADGANLLLVNNRLVRTETAISSYRVLPITHVVAGSFDRLRANKKLKKIGRADLLIACIALANDATLVTRNTKDFANIPGLKVENWAD